MKKKLILPKFKNEDDERNFWAKIDLSDYYDENDLEEEHKKQAKIASVK